MLIKVFGGLIKEREPPDLHVPLSTGFQKPQTLCFGNSGDGNSQTLCGVPPRYPYPLPPLLGLSLPLTPDAALSLAHRTPGTAPPGPTYEHGAPGQDQDGPGQENEILTAVRPPRVLLGSPVP